MTSSPPIKEFKYIINDEIVNTFLGSKLESDEIELGMIVLIQRDFDGQSTVTFYRIEKINKVNIKIIECDRNGKTLNNRLITSSKNYLYEYIPDE